MFLYIFLLAASNTNPDIIPLTNGSEKMQISSNLRTKHKMPVRLSFIFLNLFTVKSFGFYYVNDLSHLDQLLWRCMGKLINY